MQQGTRDTGAVRLVPFVPRLVVDWQRNAPGGRVREVEATLVFIDLSGFTNLSERLGRRGKVGAEEITDAIGSTFAELLRVAYEAGGSLLKFGGDALLLFFSGDGHPVRAAYAAGGMRKTLREVGRIETSAGAAILRMSTGIESGTCHLFLVGDSHRELVVAGPLPDRTVAMEAEARTGEIIVGPGTASALPASLLGPDRGPGARLSRTPRTPSGTGTPEIVEGSPEVSVFVPRAVRDHLVAGGLTPEHRQVTVGFLTFGGIGEALERHGPEGAAARIDTLISTVQEAVDAHDVSFLETDVYPGGGKILLASGAPQAQEDAEDRMLLALRTVFEADVELPIRAGVHRGHVFAGAIGPPYRKTYTVMGDAVNTAARVMSRAGWGELLATDSVRGWTRVRFDLDELPPFTVKGKRRPLTAFRVGRRLGGRRRRGGGDAPFVGREAELDELLAAVRRATEGGAGTAVEITGQPGIGKSRLVEELVARSSELRVYTAAGDPYGSSTPYFVVRTLLRSTIGVVPQDDDRTTARKLREHVRRRAPELRPWLPLLALPLDVSVRSTPEVDELAEEFKAQRLAQAVVDLLAADGDPALFVVEDVQWMDEASANAVRALVARAHDEPWTVCLTIRAEQGTGWADRQIELGPLDDGAARTLVRAVSPRPLLPQEAALVLERSGGHPLFLQELAGTGDLEGLPTTVEALVASRIDALPPPDRDLLRVLAVLGQGVEAPFARRFTQRATRLFPELPASADEGSLARLRDFVAADGRRLRFREPLFRQAAYEGLPYKRRRALHEQAGLLLEERTRVADRAEMLSLHFHEAGDRERSWRYSLEAAERSRDRFAHAPEATFLRRALDSACRLDGVTDAERAPTWEDLGLALWRASRFAEARDAFRRARRSVADPVDVARLLRREADVADRLGRHVAASRALFRALRSLEGCNTPEASAQRVRARLQLAHDRRLKGRLEEGVRLCWEALSEAEATGDQTGLANAHNMLNILLSELRHPEAPEHGHRALDLFQALGDRLNGASVLNNLGQDAYDNGDWTAALKLYEESKGALVAAGNAIGAAVVTNNLGEILSDQGDHEEAVRAFEEAETTFRAAGVPTFLAVALANRGRAKTRAGHLQDGRDLLEQAIAEASGAGSDDRLPRLFLAENVLLGRAHTEALATLEAITRSITPAHGPLFHRIRGVALAHIGRRSEARQALCDALRSARSTQAGFEMALALDALSQLDDAGPASAARAEEAQAIFERLGVRKVPSVPLPEGSGKGTLPRT